MAYTGTNGSKSAAPLGGFFIPRKAAQEAQQRISADLHHRLPSGALIHFINIRAMWMADPERPFSVVGYAKDFGVGRGTVRNVLNTLADVEGLELARTCRMNEADNGYLLVRTSPNQPVPATATPQQQKDALWQQNGIKTAANRMHSPKGGVLRSTGGVLTETGGVLTSTGGCTQEDTCRSLVDTSYISNRQKELSPVHGTEPIDRGNRKLMVEQAIAYFNDNQTRNGATVKKDPALLNTILNVATGKDDSTVAEALGTALARGHSHWELGRPSPYVAGQQLTAAVRDNWSELDSDQHSPDSPSVVLWRDGAWIVEGCELTPLKTAVEVSDDISTPVNAVPLPQQPTPATRSTGFNAEQTEARKREMLAAFQATAA